MSASSFTRFLPSQPRTALSPQQSNTGIRRENRGIYLEFRLSRPLRTPHLGERFANGVGNSLKFRSYRRFRILAHDWNSAIATRARGYVNRNLPEQWDT